MRRLSQKMRVVSCWISTWCTSVVIVVTETTLIFCDSLRMNPHEDYIECFGNVHIDDNDSVNIYSDYMKYLVSKKFVHFDKNVRLTDGKSILTSDALDY